MKICAQCRIEKHPIEFYKCKRQPSGLYSYCKECVKQQGAERYKKSKDKINAKAREYYKKNSDKIKERTKEWVSKNRQRKKFYDKEYYANLSPEQLEKALERKRIFDKSDKGKESAKKYRVGEKWKARYTFRNAIRDGKIKKIDICSICRSTERVEGHHPDYTKPLEVVWMCRKCHSAIHKSLKERNR